MTKLYILAIQGAELEDIQLTFSFAEALGWLGVKSTRSVIEYDLTEGNGITKKWTCIWHYVNGELVSQ